jgi:hypothetical protein
MAERLTTVYIGQVYLHCRQGYGLESIQYGYGGMGIGGRIDNDAVEFPIGLLDPIHQDPFVVALPDIDLTAQLLGGFLNIGYQSSIIPIPVNFRFPNA